MSTHYTILRLRLMLLFWSESTVGTRVVLACGSLLWALMLFWPGDTFGRPTYTLMHRFASEWAWASLFLVNGLYSLYAITTDQRSKTALLVEGALGCALWSGSCICMLMSVYPPPAAIAGEISLAFAAWWHLVRFPFHPK